MNMRFCKYCLLFLVAFMVTIWGYAQPPKSHTYTVVIDAGHGGKDAGAVGKISMEKDLNLSVALLTGQKLHDQYPEVRVVYTRTTDVFLPLQQRADIVNANDADLFICIHTNSAENKAVYGAETFVLGVEKMSQNLDVAMRENAVMKLEADYQTTYQGFDPNSIDSYILFELLQNRYMDQSLQFASYVQQQFTRTLNRMDRGVRQAAFWVLLKSACPSVLVEMGFISNPEEEKYLNSAQGKEGMATAIATAFQSFYRKNEPVELPKPDVEKPATTKPSKPAKPSKPSSTSEETTRFAVQICAVSIPLEANDERLKGLTDYAVFEVNGMYKYYTAVSSTREQARKKQKELKELFPDCFVIVVPDK